jgi:hypothetical protein
MYPLLESLEFIRQNGVALGNDGNEVGSASNFLHGCDVQGLQSAREVGYLFIFI